MNNRSETLLFSRAMVVGRIRGRLHARLECRHVPMSSAFFRPSNEILAAADETHGRRLLCRLDPKNGKVSAPV